MEDSKGLGIWECAVCGCVSARCGWLDEMGLLRCEGVGSVELE